MARFENYDDHRSSGVAKAGLATGITGTALAGMLGLGAIGLNNVRNNVNGCCNEEILVNRYEAQKEHDIMMLTTENAMLKNDKDTNQKILELYKYMNNKLENVEGVLANQAVKNQQNADYFTMLKGSIDAETAARCCADNTIVNYVNGTFYPQIIAGITTDPATNTVKKIYNPLNNNGCNSGCGNGCRNGCF